MFNERFKTIRQASGKTQKELADFLNISPQSVSKWEKGEALPSIEYLPLMARFFGCSINVFFEEVYENTLPDKMDEQIKISGDISDIKNKITSAFAQLKLNVEIVKVYEGIRVVTFTCAVSGKTKIKHVFNKSKEIYNIVDEKICMRCNGEENNAFVIEFAKKRFDEAPLTSALESKEYKESTAEIPIIIGYDTNDNLLIDDLASSRHILVGGGVRSGKTAFLKNVLTCLTSKFTKDEIGLVISDAKKRDLLYANEYPHLIGRVLTEIDETEIAFKCLAEEMESRYSALEAFGVPNIAKYNFVSQNKMKRIVIVIDELIDLLVYSDKIYKILANLSMKGGAVGIHLIMAINQAHGKLESIRINIPTFVTFFTEKTSDISIMMGMNEGHWLSGCGDLLYCNSEHWFTRAQAPSIDAQESLKLVKAQ